MPASPPSPPRTAGSSGAAAENRFADLEAGLDALQTDDGGARPSWRARFIRSALPPIVAVVLAVVVWQVAVTVIVGAGIKASYAMPGPLETVQTLMDRWSRGDVQAAVGNSLTRGLLGFLASIAIGTPIGLLVARVRLVRIAVGPIITGLQSLPSVAWVPMAIIWFGITDATIYFVILLGAVPSIANGLVAGLDQVPPLWMRVGRVLGARGWDSARHVLVPAALPGYLAGLKQGWAFSWRSLMAAEIIAFSPALGLGLGQLLQQGRELSDMSLVMASILLILVVGIAIELLLFAPIERRVLRARGLLAANR